MKKAKIIISILTLLFSILASGIGFGMLSDVAYSFPLRFLCGFCFIIVPLLVLQLMILMFRNTSK